MIAPDLHAISDGIKALKHLFDCHETCVLNEEGIKVVRDELERLRKLALELETFRRDSYSEARRERRQAPHDAWLDNPEITNLVCDEIERPGTNVRLFPIIPRPAFHGDNPKGAA